MFKQPTFIINPSSFPDISTAFFNYVLVPKITFKPGSALGGSTDLNGKRLKIKVMICKMNAFIKKTMYNYAMCFTMPLFSVQ